MIWLRRLHLLVAWGLVAGLFFQVFLAGLGVFESSSAFGTHAGWGMLLGLMILVLLVLAVIGGVGRRQVLYAAGLLGLFILQASLAEMRGSNPTVAALHPVNGFVIVFVAIAMAREAWAARDRQVEAAPAAALAEG